MQEQKGKVLGLVITDGVGYRNFVLSNFISEAVKEFSKIIIYSGLPASVYKLDTSETIKIRELPIFTEPFKTWFWRKSKEVAHLQLHKELFGIQDNLKANFSGSNSNRGRATRFIYKVTGSLHSERFIRFLEKKQQNSVARHPVTKKCKEFLKEDKPSILFFTHQRPPYVVPLVVAADKLKTRTCSFIFSWDNLASKGRMAANFDNYLVWSELMKKELLYFYPVTNENEVEVVGTPQFEPYVMKRYRSEKSGFFRKFNLEEGRITICYSCGDISTSRNDELYIENIAEALQKGEITEAVNFLVRTSPAEDPDRFRYLTKKYPFIRWNYPDWTVSRKDHPEPWSQRVPSETDLTDLRAVLHFSDLSINMCSTMSLDFMLFDKPVINPVFGNDENGLYNDQRFLKYAHYEKVVESGAVRIVKNRKDLIDAINCYLQNPAADKENRKELLDLQIGKPLEGTSRRIAETLKNLI